MKASMHPEIPDAFSTVKQQVVLDGKYLPEYNKSRHPGVRDSFSVFPTFHKMEPGSNGRYVMPPYYTPGDGKGVRQGTSLLYRAGEKTRASAPWGSKNPSCKGRIFILLLRFVIRVLICQASVSLRRGCPRNTRRQWLHARCACSGMSGSARKGPCFFQRQDHAQFPHPAGAHLPALE